MYPAGICFQAFIPMRKEPDEASEMVNQVLFGESFDVLEELKSKNFSHIKLHHDSYQGWINTKCINYVSPENLSNYLKEPAVITHGLVNRLISENNGQEIIIGAGSLLRQCGQGLIGMPGKEFRLQEIQVEKPDNTREKIVEYGLKMISIPYLWGGRSSFGFDCSGLCQNIFRQVGIEIPRDASLQAEAGRPLIFIDEAKPGDLAFFDNDEGKIIHAGIFVDEGKLLHASGWVKVDQIDHQGIFSIAQNRYTHSLRLIKNIID
jgi:gamma-D-glutamyl-L-lysine dipeptidyl-peptidase